MPVDPSGSPVDLDSFPKPLLLNDLGKNDPAPLAVNPLIPTTYDDYKKTRKS